MNTAVHAVRREAFLDAAQRLIQAKGYEQMSVQDLLDELDASRGAFYHYFDSKAALLEAVIDRMVVAATDAVGPVVADPHLAALDKLSLLFSGLARWKTERRDLMVAIIQVWYSDDNALVRDKLRQGTLARLAPLLARIIRQGTEEGVFTVGGPGDSARVLVWLLQGAQDLAGELVAAHPAGTIAIEAIEARFAGYTEAMERILGVPAGSLPFVDRATLRVWWS